MCCRETKTLGLPAEVIEALAHYRRLLDEHGPDWGEQIDFFRLARFSLIGPAFEAFMATGDWATAIRSVIGSEVPAGIVVVRVDEDGALRADVGPARTAIAGRTVRLDVVVDSAAAADLSLTVAGRNVRVAQFGATVETIDVDGADPAFTVVLGDETLCVDGAIRSTAAVAREVLRSAEERTLAAVLAEAAESVARAVEVVREGQPGAWMDSSRRLPRRQNRGLLREDRRQDGHPEAPAYRAGDPLQPGGARCLAHEPVTPKHTRPGPRLPKLTLLAR